MKRVVQVLTVWNVVAFLGWAGLMFWLVVLDLANTLLPETTWTWVVSAPAIAWLLGGPVTIIVTLVLNRWASVRHVNRAHVLLALTWPPTALITLFLSQL